MSLPKLQIEYPDGATEVVQCKPSDVTRFEVHFGIPYMSAWVDAQMAVARAEQLAVGDDAPPEKVLEYMEAVERIEASISMSHLYFLAWSAKTKGAGIPFEEWLDTIEGAEWRSSGADAAPLDPGGSTPTSSDTPASPLPAAS